MSEPWSCWTGRSSNPFWNPDDPAAWKVKYAQPPFAISNTVDPMNAPNRYAYTPASTVTGTNGSVRSSRGPSPPVYDQVKYFSTPTAADDAVSP